MATWLNMEIGFLKLGLVYKLLIKNMEKLMTTPNLEELMRQEFKIIDFKTRVVNLSLITPMKLPFGEVTERPSGVVSIRASVAGKTVYGFGEGATLPKPLFTDDCGETIGLATDELLKRLSQEQVGFNKAIRLVQAHKFNGNFKFPTARMAVEMTLIDLLSKSFRLNVGSMLGLPDSIHEVSFGKSLGGGSLESTLQEAEESIQSGAKKIKLKVTPGNSDTVLQVIHQLGLHHHDLELMVDANGTFNPQSKNDLDWLRALDEVGLIMIEEPVSRAGDVKGIEAVRLLKKSLPDLTTPICLDDCLSDFKITNTALEENLADIVNIKPGRIGSIKKAIELAKRCKELNKQIMVGGMLEATPGRCMTTTLAALFHSMGFTIPGDLSLAQERLSDDLVPKENQLQIGQGGSILIPKGIGWGFGVVEFKK